MTTEQIAFVIILVFFVAVGSFFLGFELSDSAWRHRTRVREMLHEEKMALIKKDLMYDV